MVPIEAASASTRWVAATVLILVAATVAVTQWRSSPPQMGPDEETFKTVDALFTALTSRNVKLLDECERRLSVQRDSGKLPKRASQFLTSVIAQARQGKWDAAAKRLYDFMYGQRRR